MWVVFALLHSLFRAVYTETGRLFDVDNWLMSFWQAVFAALLIACLFPFMIWPDDPRFYFAAGIVGVMVAVGSLILLGLIAERNGRVAAIYMPLEAIAACVIWMTVSPTMLGHYIADPLLSAAVLVAFTMAAVGLFWIRPNDFNVQTLSVVAPLGMTYAVIGVVTKIVMPEVDLLPTALSFSLIVFCGMAATLLIALGFKRMIRPAMVARRVLAAGVVTGVISALAYTSFVVGVAYAPNPGYVSFMVMLLPVWLWLFHLARGKREQINISATVLLVLGAGILIVATLLA